MLEFVPYTTSELPVRPTTKSEFQIRPTIAQFPVRPNYDAKNSQFVPTTISEFPIRHN